MGVDVVVVVHGSRSMAAYRELQEMIRYVEESVSTEGLGVSSIHFTFNGRWEGVPVPDWREVVSQIIDSGGRNIAVIPLFLFQGTHVERDIMGYFGLSAPPDQWIKTEFNGREINLYIASTLSRSALLKLAILGKIGRAVRDFEHRSSSGGRVYDSTGFQDIEAESMGRALEIVDSISPALSEFSRRILARVVFATGNPNLAHHVYIHPRFEEVAREVLRLRTTPVVADVKMVYVGIRWRSKYTFIDSEEARAVSREKGLTRSAAGMLEAAARFKTFVPVVGNSPSALLQVLELVRGGYEVPLAIATPPGFVNAEYAKEKLIASHIPCVVVRGSFGGSSIAVAVFNEVVRWVG